MVLRAYFDESGTHKNAQTTCISGFVGSDDIWASVDDAWRASLGSIPYFHYFDFEDRRDVWEPLERWQRDPIRAALADILVKSDLVPVSAVFAGMWNPQVFDATVNPGRYPDPYSFCFEVCMEMLLRGSQDRFGGESVAVMMGRQDQFGPDAVRYFDIFKHNREWAGIATPIAFGDMREIPALQAADMLAYEHYQFLLSGHKDGWMPWPLLSGLFSLPQSEMLRKTQFSVYHTPKSVEAIAARGPIQRLEVPKRNAP